MRVTERVLITYFELIVTHNIIDKGWAEKISGCLVTEEWGRCLPYFNSNDDLFLPIVWNSNNVAQSDQRPSDFTVGIM